jgi:uncharacterized membrane protein YidH (DUF202 family)
MAKRDLWGRLLLSLAVISVGMAPITADLNETHIFNDDWPPHARFHTAVLLFISAGLSVIGLWLLWRKTSELRTHLFLAMLIPVLAWGSFFLALLIPGTAVEDVPGDLPRVVGLPLNLFVGLVIMLLSVLACSLSVSSNNAQEAARRRQPASAG